MPNSTERINQLLEAMQQLQLENENIWESLQKLQVGTPMELEDEKTKSLPTSRNLLSVEHGPSAILTPIPLHPTSTIEPNVSLLDKFDGTTTRL